jgi:hypothetical protein
MDVWAAAERAETSRTAIVIVAVRTSSLSFMHGLLLDEHDLAETRRDVRPGIVVLRSTK